MSRIHISVSVNNKSAPQDIEDAVAKGIIRATSPHRNSGTIQSHGEALAKEKIYREGAIWRGELVHSFEHSATRKIGGRQDTRRAILKNTADHAAPIEEGADYSHEGPPVEALIPWVQSKMPPIHEMERAGAWTDAPLEPPLDKYEPEVVRRAFWLQETIRQHGIRGIGFMDHAQRHLYRGDANDIVALNINRELRKVV